MATEIKINENSIILDGVEYVKKEQQQPTPKDGEVWCVETSTEEWLFIKRENKYILGSYLAFSPSDGYIDTGNDVESRVTDDDNIKSLRPATPEEIALLHSKLAEKGKVWNAEKKQLEDLPKTLKEGELVIGWDGNKKDAIIGTYNGQKHRNYLVGIVYMDNAIPFESIEQYKEFIKG